MTALRSATNRRECLVSNSETGHYPLPIKLNKATPHSFLPHNNYLSDSQSSPNNYHKYSVAEECCRYTV